MLKEVTTPQKHTAILRRGIVAILVLLVIQFGVGMYLNFYTELPASHPGTIGTYAPSIPWALSGVAGVALAIHVVVWILLTLAGIALLGRSIILRNKTYIIGTALGFVFILTAGSGGLTFLNRGGDDKESMQMAVTFILALVTYAVTFYKTQKIPKP